MIIFSKLERKGNLGNQLFQIASTIGIAKSNDHRFGFPKWSYETFFKNKLPEIKIENIEVYQEETFHFSVKKFDNKNYDLDGWFQSEKYFDHDLTKHFFEFEPKFLVALKLKFQSVFEKKTILISIRRGDFVNHPDYFQLPINYYLNALIHNFPDWREKNLVLLSDDIDYCKFHFSFLENVFFADNLTAIEQLAIASLCDDFIISNSTFSWWCAWLGEKESSKIIRPLHYFTEFKNKIDNDKDYFPERWKIYNHLDVKIDLGKTVIVLKKANSILEEYVAHYFRFENENRKLYLNSINENLNYKEYPLLLINDCVFPPLSVYYSYLNQKNYIGFLKGNYFNISKYWQYNLFKKQYDFGLFTKILNTKKCKVNRKEWLFVIIPKMGYEFGTINYNNFETFEKLGFTELKLFAGKIKGIFELKYFYVTKKRVLIIFTKSKLKKILKLKR